MKVEGQCHCGQISFEAEIDPDMVRICHCTDCQTLSGSAYRVSVQAAAAGFRLLTGVPKIYIKTAESGNQRAQLQPSRQIWSRSAQPWVKELRHVQQVERQ